MLQLNPVGAVFDPNVHEAVFQVPATDDHPTPNTVAQVLTIGYTLHERPIRPAKVAVVKAQS